MIKIIDNLVSWSISCFVLLYLFLFFWTKRTEAVFTSLSKEKYTSRTAFLYKDQDPSFAALFREIKAGLVAIEERLEPPKRKKNTA